MAACMKEIRENEEISVRSKQQALGAAALTAGAGGKSESGKHIKKWLEGWRSSAVPREKLRERVSFSVCCVLFWEKLCSLTVVPCWLGIERSRRVVWLRYRYRHARRGDQWTLLRHRAVAVLHGKAKWLFAVWREAQWREENESCQCEMIWRNSNDSEEVVFRLKLIVSVRGNDIIEDTVSEAISTLIQW